MGIFNKIRSSLYATAKIMGDVNAVQKGKIVQRVKNRIVGKLTGKLLSKK
jgi:hypothetical protein